MKDPINEALFMKVARKTKLPAYKVKEIVTSQFKFVHRTMRNPDMPAIKLDYLGKFHVHPRRKEYLDKYLAEKKARNK